MKQKNLTNRIIILFWNDIINFILIFNIGYNFIDIFLNITTIIIISVIFQLIELKI